MRTAYDIIYDIVLNYGLLDSMSTPIGQAVAKWCHRYPKDKIIIDNLTPEDINQPNIDVLYAFTYYMVHQNNEITEVCENGYKKQQKTKCWQKTCQKDKS